MTKGIINSDGSRNWQANILLDNIKRLEFELKATKADYEASEQENKQMKSALEEIREKVSRHYPGRPRDILDIINEALS